MRHAIEDATHPRHSHTNCVNESDSHKGDKQGSLAVYVGHTRVYVVVHQAQLQTALLAGDAVVHCSGVTPSALGLIYLLAAEVCIRRLCMIACCAPWDRACDIGRTWLNEIQQAELWRLPAACTAHRLHTTLSQAVSAGDNKGMSQTYLPQNRTG